MTTNSLIARNADSSSKPEVAFLVFSPVNSHNRKDTSFDGFDNTGAKVIEDVLVSNGIPVGYCSPESANQFKVVLVSFTSTYDCLAFYRAVALRPDWQPGKRKFKVLAGGFGMQNPTTVRNFIDYAAFGRYEDLVTPVVESLLAGERPKENGSLMFLPDLHGVEIAQAQKLYPNKLGWWQESFTGCPLKCKFCHYTYARKHQGSDEAYGQYVQTAYGENSPELTWDQIVIYNDKVGHVSAALDGFSMRLRYIYGKRISDEDIVAGIENMGSHGGTTFMKIYNISNFPSETEADREVMYSTLRKCKPKDKVVFILHSTPFRPSLATPMQWEPVSLYPSVAVHAGKVIVDYPTLRATHSLFIESAWTHLVSMVIERATPETDKLFHAVAFSPKVKKLKHAQRVNLIKQNFDVAPYLREYDPEEKHPAWFLDGWLQRERLAFIARKMRGEIERSVAEPGWIPGKASMVKYRVRKALPVLAA